MDHSYVSALRQLHLQSRLDLASMDWARITARRDGDHLSLRIFAAYTRDLTVHCTIPLSAMCCYLEKLQYLAV